MTMAEMPPPGSRLSPLAGAHSVPFLPVPTVAIAIQHLVANPTLPEEKKFCCFFLKKSEDILSHLGSPS